MCYNYDVIDELRLRREQDWSCYNFNTHINFFMFFMQWTFSIFTHARSGEPEEVGGGAEADLVFRLHPHRVVGVGVQALDVVGEPAVHRVVFHLVQLQQASSSIPGRLKKNRVKFEVFNIIPLFLWKDDFHFESSEWGVESKDETLEEAHS